MKKKRTSKLVEIICICLVKEEVKEQRTLWQGYYLYIADLQESSFSDVLPALRVTENLSHHSFVLANSSIT
jgi:hypothetical protein